MEKAKYAVKIYKQILDKIPIRYIRGLGKHKIHVQNNIRQEKVDREIIQPRVSEPRKNEILKIEASKLNKLQKKERIIFKINDELKIYPDKIADAKESYENWVKQFD